MRRTGRKLMRPLVGAAAGAVFVTGAGATTAQAEPSPPVVPGSDDPTTIPTAAPTLPGEEGPAEPEYSEAPDSIADAGPPVETNTHAAGLHLADGAELAPAKVLDIKFVTEDMDGAERREDSTRKTKFTLQAAVLFPKDSAKLNEGARDRINEIAEEAEGQNARELDVFGFTDDLGSYEHGKKLSKNRAEAVQKALAETLGSDVTFHVRGYSEDYPVADNSTEEGRKKNRRVEVSFPRQE